MPAAGDRVVFEGVKIGGGRREGQLVSIDGRAVRVRWEDGSESLMFPGPGAMRVLEPAPRKKAPAKAAKPAAAAGKKAAAKKPAPKKAVPAKTKAATKKAAPAKGKSKTKKR